MSAPENIEARAAFRGWLAGRVGFVPETMLMIYESAFIGGATIVVKRHDTMFEITMRLPPANNPNTIV